MTAILRALMIAGAIGGSFVAADAEPIAFRALDGHLLYGDVYGAGDRGVVILAHGGYSTRASWKAAADALAAEQFRVLVFESRGAADFAAGKETPCLSDDACQSPEKIPGRKLFITARHDANAAGLRLPGIQAQYARARPPKEFMLVDGSAHGQNLLATPQGAAVLRRIGLFLAGTKP